MSKGNVIKLSNHASKLWGTETIVEKVIVTPDTAAQWLKHNRINRPVSRGHVATLAKQIEDGRWQFNGQPIVIADDEEVLDGQHRLHACIEAGKPIETLVVYGVARDAFRTIDTGKSRTGSDVLTLDYPEAPRDLVSAVASGARLSIFMDDKTLNRFERVSNSEIIDYVERNPEIWMLGRRLSELTRGVRPLGMGSTLALYLQFHRRDSDLADQFMRDFYTGVELKDTSVVFMLREMLASDQQRHTRWSNTHKMRMVVKAWNCLRAKGGRASRNLISVRAADPAWIDIR